MPFTKKGNQSLSVSGDTSSPGSASPSNNSLSQKVGITASDLRKSPSPQDSASVVFVASNDDLSTIDMPCVSPIPVLRHGHDPESGIRSRKVPSRDQFTAEMEACFKKLSPRAQSIAKLDVVEMLRGVPNSAAAMTRFFSFADTDRLCHSKHTASKVQAAHESIKRNLAEQERAEPGLQPKALSDHEVQVLECVALLHDLGHRLGSHSLDRVLAAHPSAPKIHKAGWGQEFHEFHTAMLVAFTSELKDELGPLFGDVLAVLTFCDNRPGSTAVLEAEFEKDFGRFSPTPGVRIGLIHEIVEKVLDRNSCLELDFRRGGFADWLVELNQSLVIKMEGALTLYRGPDGDELRLRVHKGQLPRDAAGWIREDDLFAYVSCRQLYREVVASSPASCSVDVFLREAVWRQLDRGLDSPFSQTGFENLRNMVRGGKYEELLGRDAYQLLTRAPHDPALLALEDIVAPLVTMTKDDFFDKGKLSTLEAQEGGSVAPQGHHRDLTLFEQELRVFLEEQRDRAKEALAGARDERSRKKHLAMLQAASADVAVVITTDIEKVIPYKIIEPDPDGKVPFKPGETTNVLAVQSSYKAVKIAIAARAFNDEGQPVYLARTQRLVEEFCKSRPYLRKGCTENFDRHFFARSFLPEPFVKEIELQTSAASQSGGDVLFRQFHDSKLRSASGMDLFAPEIQARMRRPELKWELRGYHGLRDSDVPPVA